MRLPPIDRGALQRLPRPKVLGNAPVQSVLTLACLVQTRRGVSAPSLATPSARQASHWYPLCFACRNRKRADMLAATGQCRVGQAAGPARVQAAGQRPQRQDAVGRAVAGRRPVRQQPEGGRVQQGGPPGLATSAHFLLFICFTTAHVGLPCLQAYAVNTNFSGAAGLDLNMLGVAVVSLLQSS